MGFMDELKKLAKPYSEDDEFDDFDEDVKPARSSRRSASSAASSAAPSSFSDFDTSDLDQTPSARRTPGGSKVVNIHTTAQMQVVLVKPDRFDNVSDIADHLRSKHAVVLNLRRRTRTLRGGWSISCPAAPTRSTARSKRSPSAPTSSRPTTWTSWAI